MPGQCIAFSLDGSPYTIDATGQHVLEEAAELQERAGLLRQRGRLTETTLRACFGDKRYEQVAESNAVEGSTLSVGETGRVSTRWVDWPAGDSRTSNPFGGNTPDQVRVGKVRRFTGSPPGIDD